MNRKIGFLFQQRHFEFFGKQAFRKVLTFFGQRGSLELVPGGFDNFQFKVELGEGGFALRQNHVGLSQGQRTAAGSDVNLILQWSQVIGLRVREKSNFKNQTRDLRWTEVPDPWSVRGERELYRQ